MTAWNRPEVNSSGEFAAALARSIDFGVKTMSGRLFVVLEVSAFTAEESFEGWAAGVGAAWEEGEESDVLSAGSERAGAGVVDPPGSAVADAASCEDPSEERAGAPVDVVVEAGSGEVSAGEP